MNQYERRRRERDMEAAARSEKERENRVDKVREVELAVRVAHYEAYGTDIKVRYYCGWYRVGEGRGVGYRRDEIFKMIARLRAVAHVKENNKQIEHPEYLEEDN